MAAGFRSFRTNADGAEQTDKALDFGTTGIDLTRTEHMCFDGNCIDAMRDMILDWSSATGWSRTSKRRWSLC